MTQTLKKGSRGEEVRLLQRTLGIADDGIYGADTEQAVKAFQRSKGLTADGIAGPKTFAALGISDSKCIDTSVTYAPLSVHVTKRANRSIKYIAIHYTAGARSSNGSALRTRKGWETRAASADFVVDDKDIIQCNPDIRNYYCWAVGDKFNPYSLGGSLYGIATNANTISIEICSNLVSGASASAANHDGWYFTSSALDNAVRLTKMLMKIFSIPADRVVRHYDISGKLCPGIPGWNDATLYERNGNKTQYKSNSCEWTKFKSRL